MLVLGFGTSDMFWVGLSHIAEATRLPSIEYSYRYIVVYIRSMRTVKVNQAEKQGGPLISKIANQNRPGKPYVPCLQNQPSPFQLGEDELT